MLLREKELRCFCRADPLLATYGVDSKGVLFVHIKVYKGNRIYSESVTTGGTVKIKCRNCRRWHRVNIMGYEAELKTTPVPETLSNGV